MEGLRERQRPKPIISDYFAGDRPELHGKEEHINIRYSCDYV